MKLLILGESDSIGMALTEPEIAWGNQIPVQVADHLGQPPETLHVRFYSWGDGALPYLESVLEKGPFDVVVISATKVGFTVFSADNRVRKVLGNRAGDWFKTTANTVDRSTRWHKPPSWKRSLNEVAHKTVRRAIGQAPVTSMEAVTEGYMRAFARLARLEDTQVIVVVAPPIPSPAARRRPRLATVVERFRSSIVAESARRRFDVVDPEAFLPPPGPERDALFVDEVHKTPELHRLLAGAVAETILNAATRDK